MTAVANQICLLSFHRLARIQVTSVSSVVTTGIQNIDYYISGSLTETTKDAEQHYQEKLIKLDGAAHCFSYGAAQTQETMQVDSEDLNIPSDAIVFASLANMFKITPELCNAWAKIITAVPNSVLILFPFGPNWSNAYPTKSFSKHLNKIFSSYGLVQDRLIIMEPYPALSRDGVKEYLKLTDIYLDSYPFSGTTSLIEPLEVGIPVVTKQGGNFRSSMGAALLKELGIPELVTDAEESYLELAIALGNEPELRQGKSIKIKQKMQENPGFLDSRSYGGKMGTLFQELLQIYEVTTIKEKFKLRDVNLIVSPQWSLPENQIYQQLASVISTLVKHPDKDQITLLINTGEFGEEEANLVVSDIVMNLLLEEDLDVSTGPEITLLRKLDEAHWETLLPQVQARIILEEENEQVTAAAKTRNIPSLNLDTFNSKRAFQLEMGTWSIR